MTSTLFPKIKCIRINIVVNFAHLKEGRVQKSLTDKRLSSSISIKCLWIQPSILFSFWVLVIAITHDHVIAVWSMTHTGCGYEYLTILFRAVTRGTRPRSPHVTPSLNNPRYLERSGVPAPSPTSSLLYMVCTLTLNSDDSWSSDRRVIDHSYRV